MQPNSSQLARRDLALASILGIVATGGSNFGSEPSFAGEFSADFSEDGFGYDTYSGFSADAIEAPKPTPQQAVAAYNQQYAAQANRNNRVRLLNPNKGSDIKVERYSFTIEQALTIGTASSFVMSGNPDTAIRPQILTMNAPTVMFVMISEIKVANVSVSVGPGREDAFDYNALGQGRALDMPTLTPANRASVAGAYTGYVPPGFPALMAVTFMASFKGPATIAG